MIRLNQTASQLISLITAQNGANVVVSYSDKTTTAYSGNTQVTNITSATTTTICDTPAASTIRDVDHISIKNTFAGSHTITVQLSSSATLYPMLTIALLTNETAEYTHGSGWRCLDANGNLKATPLTAMTSAQLAAILSDETGSGSAVFATGPTLSLPNANNFRNGLTSTTTAAGTTTLTSASNYQQMFTGTTTQTAVMPDATTLVVGHAYYLHNESTGAVTVNANGGGLIVVLAAGTGAIFVCTSIATAAGSWDFEYFSIVSASGKKLTNSNTLTLAGTDGTTMTFPSTSATIARTDAAQTFTGTQTFGAIEPTSINGVTTDSTSNRPETHMSMMPHVASKAQAMCIDLTASSTVGGLTAADNANLDHGTNNFTLAITAALPDYTPSADAILLQKTDGTNGYKLSLLTTGKLRLTINTTNYDSTVATGLTDGAMAAFGAIVTRESASLAGSVVFKVNELTLGASVSITAGAPTTVDNASAFYIGGTATTRFAMRYKSCRIFNLALTDAQWVDFVKNGVAFADIGASQVSIYASDFSVGADNWLNFTGTTIAGNIDTIGGENDWLRATVDSSNNVHALRNVSLTNLTYGKRYRVSIKYFISSANANVGGFLVQNQTGAIVISAEAVFATKDVATTLSFEYVHVDYFEGLSVYLFDKVSSTIAWLGNGTDVAYFKLIDIKPIGAVANYDVPGIQPNQVHDSANDNHLSFPTSGASLSLWKETGQYNWTTAITGDTTLTSIVPAGYELEKILFKNSTAGAVSVRLGTTAGGTEVFGLTALNTSATFGGFKTISVNQGFSLTAAQTLYLSSTDWTGGGTPPSLTFTAYFRRIS